MPRIPSDRVARILEGMELQAILRKTNASAPLEQTVAIGGDEMGEASAEPEVAVQPEAAAHRVDHPLTSVVELLPAQEQRRGILRRRDLRTRRVRRVGHWQATTPSEVAGAGAATNPEYIAQVRGYDIGCVAMADHPPTVAVTIWSCVPFVVR